MRRLLTFAVVAGVIGVAGAAAIDVLRGSSPSPGDGHPARETTGFQPLRFPPSLATWEGDHRRTVRLSRVVGAGWEEIRRLDPGSYALTVRIELPHTVDVDVWFESATGNAIDLLGRGHPRDCRRLKDRDLCVTRVDVLQDEAEGWRLLARKIFRGPTVIHLRITFTKTGSAYRRLGKKSGRLGLYEEGVEKHGHDDEYLSVFHEDAEGWAERERERDLMAVLVEAAHLKSAARSWYRRRAPALPVRRPPRPGA